MLRSDLCDYSDSYIVVKLIMNVVEEIKSQLSIITFHLDYAYPKSIPHF